MFVSSKFRDFLGSDPASAYLTELAAAAARIDPFAGDSDTLVRDEPSRAHFAGGAGKPPASAPVFIPAPVFKPEFIPASVGKPEWHPAVEVRSADA